MNDDYVDLSDLHDNCKTLVNQSLLMIKTYIDDLKQTKTFNKEKIDNIAMAVNCLNEKMDRMNEIKNRSETLNADDPDYLLNMVDIGDAYQKWMYEYTSNVMPHLESLKNDLQRVNNDD